MKKVSQTLGKNVVVQISDKGLISRLHEKTSTYKKKEQLNLKNTIIKGLGQHYTKKAIQMANKHIKKCSTSLVIRKFN